MPFPVIFFFAAGLTGGCPANMGGISTSVFVMSTATGFRSLPCASNPRRCASRGIDPPPQNGSYIGGGWPSVDFRISSCGAFKIVGLFELSHFHQLFNQPEKPLPLLVLIGFCGELLGKARRVVHQRSEQGCSARRQRPPCPPKVQRRRVPVPNRLLPRRLLIDRLQRQRDFDEFLLHLDF
jgi:hypothetical protein